MLAFKWNQHLNWDTSSFPLQYENQAKVFGNWGTTGLVGRHKYSDVTGKLKLKQEYFMPPRGWEWEADWLIDPEKAWVKLGEDNLASPSPSLNETKTL